MLNTLQSYFQYFDNFNNYLGNFIITYVNFNYRFTLKDIYDGWII